MPNDSRKLPDLHVTELLHQWAGGDVSALDQVVEKLYDYLHRRVHSLVAREHNRGILDTTDILHDLYIELRKLKTIPSNDTGHFIRASARIVRHLLVTAARRRKADKHGGKQIFVTLTSTNELADEREHTLDVLILDDILTALEGASERIVSIVELSIFLRMSQRQIAETLKIHRTTVQRDWLVAKRLIVARYRGERANASS